MNDTNNDQEHKEEDLVSILRELNAKISDHSNGAKITLGELLSLMHTKGIVLCILILALPSFFPGLLPPFPSILAVPMMLLAWQLVIRRDSIYLPRFIARVPLGRKVMTTIITKFVYYLNKLPQRRDASPFIPEGRMESVIGAMIILFAMMMFIPLPFTNFLPSVGTAFVALGLLKQSRLYALVGAAIGFIGVFVALAAVAGLVSLAT